MKVSHTCFVKTILRIMLRGYQKLNYTLYVPIKISYFPVRNKILNFNADRLVNLRPVFYFIQLSQRSSLISYNVVELYWAYFMTSCFLLQ